MNLSINPGQVLQAIANIESQMELVAASVDRIKADVSAGWDSHSVAETYTPTVQKIKDSITEINASVKNIKSNVETYVANVQKADTAGSFDDGSNSSTAGGNGSSGSISSRPNYTN